MNDTFSPPDGLLVLPRLRVQNANAVSSPLTWGFPSPTAFLGFVHALERQLGSRSGVTFGGVGIVCHAFEAQTFRPNRRQHLVFTQSRNPVYLKRDIAKFIAEGTPAAIVEEGRAHLEVSLVVAANGYFEEARHEEAFAQAAYNLALGMRIAGGSVLPPTTHRAPQPEWVPWPAVQAERRKAFARLRRRLLPGFALIHRPDLLRERLAELQAGSDPLNSNDKPGFVVKIYGAAEVEFASEVGKKYQVQQVSDVTGTWLNAGPVTNGTGNNISMVTSTRTGEGGFFRVVQVP